LARHIRQRLDARTWALNTTVGLDQTLVSTAIDLALFAVPADVILAWAWRESRIAADFATSRFTTRTGGSIGAAELRALAQDYRLNNGARIERGTLATRVVEPNSLVTSRGALRYAVEEWAASELLVFRNSGQALTASEIADFERFIARHHGNARLVADSPTLAQRLKPNEAARFDVTAAGEMTIVYRAGDPNLGYYLLHEHLHLLHYRRVGYAQFTRITPAAAEQFVYDEMKFNFWRHLSPQQQRDAAFQVFSRGGNPW